MPRMPANMAPKHKVRNEDEDISQLRKPITIHGKPVEQILNSIHYGSPELRSLIMNECDIIFECKVCRALFRDLPNLIAHKRRYCLKSSAENNYLAFSELPDERVVVVQPQAAESSKARAVNSSAQSTRTPSRPSLEETVHRMHWDAGTSRALQVYSNAETKLRHQKDNTKITSIRTTAIPSNSNAVFVNVSTTSVNIHERSNMGAESDKKASSSVKNIISKTRERNKGREKPSLRSQSTNKNTENSAELTNMLMRELKAMQHKVKTKAQPQRLEKEIKETKALSNNTVGNSQSNQKTQSGRLLEEPCEESMFIKSNGPDDTGLIEITGQNFKNASKKTEKGLSDFQAAPSSKASSDSGVVINKNELKASKKSLICSKCRSIFSSRKSLQYHIKTQHSMKKMFFPCPCCPSVYSYLSAVIRHLLSNHKKSKREVDAMREELRSKAFSKRISTQSQDSVRAAKRNISGIRQSLRYKNKSSNKMLNSAPFLYSSVKKRKSIPAKKDSSVLEFLEKDVKSRNSVGASGQDSNQDQSPVVTMKSERREECVNVSRSHVKPTRSQTKTEGIEVKEESSSLRPVSTDNNKVPFLVKPSIDIDSEMQTCPKCSKLFGRKSTFENHIKICGGAVLSVNSVMSESESKIGTPSRENSPVITRNKNKGPLHGSNFTSTTTSINTPPNKVLKVNNKVKEEGDNSRGSEVSHRANEDCASDEFISNYSKPSPCTPTSLAKTVRLSEAGDAVNTRMPVSELQTALQKPQEEEFPESRKDVDRLPKSTSDSVFTVTRLKSKSLPVTTSSSVEAANMDQGVAAVKNDESIQKTTDDVELMGVSPEAPTAVERPRRKRRVPSRNIGAVEFLQKIHRPGKDDASQRTDRIDGLVENTRPTQNDVPRKRYRQNDLSLRNCDNDSGKAASKKVAGSNVARNRVTANKMFVLGTHHAGKNRSKLQCYDHSKVLNYMDIKNLTCLKCGDRFSFIHNLKRHIVRLHLKWSRFQCKLCNFSCFDKSECNTHIIRVHRKGQRPDRNHFFNTLIIDLAKKGSQAMSLKKHKTIKAKKQLQENEKNIYKNQNAQKVPRLQERTAKADSPWLQSADRSVEKPHSQPKVEIKEDCPNGITKQVSPLSSVTCQVKNSSANVRSMSKISHLVERTQQSSSPLPLSAAASPEKVKQEAIPGIRGSEKEPVPAKTSSTSSSHSITAPSGKRNSLPFNISTRNSPRVFDTTPYNREETTTTAVVEEETDAAQSEAVHSKPIAHNNALPAETSIEHRKALTASKNKNTETIVGRPSDEGVLKRKESMDASSPVKELKPSRNSGRVDNRSLKDGVSVLAGSESKRVDDKSCINEVSDSKDCAISDSDHSSSRFEKKHISGTDSSDA